MTYHYIRYHTEGALAWLSLNRPDKLNAINGAIIVELNHALDRAEQDDAVRVILLTGEGKAFSAGFDLEMDAELTMDSASAKAGQAEADEGRAADEEAIRRELQRDFDIIMRFQDSPKPTVAAVHRYCLGSAMEMAVACDITIAASDCRFGAPEVRFGSGIVALILPWLCGPKRAREMLLAGSDRITPQQAEAWGLVNRVVEPEKLLATAREIANDMAVNDPVAVRLTKRAINRGLDTAGMRKAMQEALEIAVEIEMTDTEESRMFNEIMKKQGTRAAIEWRHKNMG